MFESLLSAYSPKQVAILRHIYHQGKITRADLTKLSGFQLLTVTKAVSKFMEDGLVIEAGFEASTGGRKAAQLSINPSFRYTLAVDIGSSCVRIGVVGMDGSVVECEMIQMKVFADGRYPSRMITVEMLRDKLRALCTKYGKKHILGLGIGISGVVRHKENRIVFCPNIGGWNDVDMVKEFQEPLGIPVFVDTAARCMALAEYTLGAGKGVPNQVSVSIGSSVGAGILLDGKIYRGADESAGELGHTTVKADGKRCTCGNTGCLELYITLPMLTKQARDLLPMFKGYSPLKNLLQDRDLPTAVELRQSYLDGDKVAIQVLQDCAETLGTAISYVANILNPSLIVLGGATVDQFPELVTEVERTVKHRSFTVTQQSLSIRPYALGITSAMVGAALQVIGEFL